MEDNHPSRFMRLFVLSLPVFLLTLCLIQRLENRGETKSSIRVPKESSSSASSCPAVSQFPLWSGPSGAAKITRAASVCGASRWHPLLVPLKSSSVAFFFLRMCFNLCHSVLVLIQGESFFKGLFHFKSIFFDLCLVVLKQMLLLVCHCGL